MVKDDSLYIIAIVAVVAVVGLVVMATGSSSTVMVAEDLPSMVEDSDSTAIAGQAISASGGGNRIARVSGVSSRDATVTAISELEEETRGYCFDNNCESLCQDQTYGYGDPTDTYEEESERTEEEWEALEELYDSCVETCNEEGWMDDVEC